MLRRLLDEARRFARYGAVGAATTIALYLVYLVLLAAGVAPVTAAGICYLPGVALSYVGNRRFTFDSNESHRSDLPKFLGAYAAGLVSTLVTVTVMLRWLGPELAQLVNIVVTPIVIYTSLRLLRFGQQEVSADAA
ncbi:MAG: GtrA family protein [Actinomycetota bacterium]